jgi:hypothetical protein
MLARRSVAALVARMALGAGAPPALPFLLIRAAPFV